MVRRTYSNNFNSALPDYRCQLFVTANIVPQIARRAAERLMVDKPDMSIQGRKIAEIHLFPGNLFIDRQ
jgi:hypothetical protein